MNRLWALKQAYAGLLLAAISLLVARDYLRTPKAPPPPPGLRLEPGGPSGQDEAQPPDPLSRHSTTVGLIYAAVAVLGMLIALFGLIRL